MKRSVLLPSVLMLLVGLVFSPMAEAAHQGKRCGSKKCLYKKVMKKAKFFKNNAKELGLTESQIKSIKNIKLEAKKKAIRLKADIKITKVDIKSELYNHKIDTNKVNGLIDQKYKFKNEKAKVLVKAIADMKNVLNAKQFAKAKEIWQEKKKNKCEKCPKSAERKDSHCTKSHCHYH